MPSTVRHKTYNIPLILNIERRCRNGMDVSIYLSQEKDFIIPELEYDCRFPGIGKSKHPFHYDIAVQYSE